MRIAVILACHDRRALTVRALEGVRASADAAGVDAVLTVFDDGSTDGTAAALAALPFPVDRIAGDGSAYWARGMALAERRALTTAGDADALVWLNDDVDLDPDAVGRLIAAAATHPGAILVGAVREPDGRTSYSGYRRRGRHPLRLGEVQPDERTQPLDTFNGNLVLVPMPVVRRLGRIDGGFAHQLADVDYGFRARRAGIAVLLAPGTFGVCPTNPPRASRGALADWRDYRSPKGGGHAASMRRALRRSAPLTWPVWMLQTSALWWLRAAGRALTAQRPPAGSPPAAPPPPPRS